MYTPAPPPNPTLLSANTLPLDVTKTRTAKMWGTSFVQYTLTAAGNSSYTILDLEMVDAAPLDSSPIWLYSRSWDGCGSTGDRIVRLNLDTDKGRMTRATQNAGQTEANGPSAFDPFSVTKDATFTILVQAHACQTSQKFNLRLSYQKAGDSTVSEQTLGPYEIVAARTDLPTYEATLEGREQSLKRTDQSKLIKPLAGCTANW